MTIVYFSGGEADSYDMEVGTASGSAAGLFSDLTFVRGGLLMASNRVYKATLSAAASDMYFMSAGDIRTFLGSTTDAVLLYRKGANDVFRVLMSGSNATGLSMTAEYFDGSWNNILTGFSFPYNKKARWGIRFKNGASGVFAAYVEGRRVAHVTGAYNTTQSDWDNVLIGGPNTTGGYFSQVLMTDKFVPQHVVNTLYPQTTTPTHTAWNNTAAAIDEANTINTGDFIDSDVVAQKETANMSDAEALAVSGSRMIVSVGTSAAGTIEVGSTPADVSFLMRHLSTDYTQTAFSWTADGTIQTHTQDKTLDPAGAAWTTSTVNALEMGVITT